MAPWRQIKVLSFRYHPNSLDNGDGNGKEGEAAENKQKVSKRLITWLVSAQDQDGGRCNKLVWHGDREKSAPQGQCLFMSRQERAYLCDEQRQCKQEDDRGRGRASPSSSQAPTESSEKRVSCCLENA